MGDVEYKRRAVLGHFLRLHISPGIFEHRVTKKFMRTPIRIGHIRGLLITRVARWVVRLLIVLSISILGTLTTSTMVPVSTTLLKFYN